MLPGGSPDKISAALQKATEGGADSSSKGGNTVESEYDSDDTDDDDGGLFGFSSISG